MQCFSEPNQNQDQGFGELVGESIEIKAWTSSPL